ncbi:peptidase family C78-domain-containing protein [Massariosphaeria phaeospora]|uniref:Peptidase family C78-domain-containing protein n=1 Tax=Massariosphaeria phaeospora TaxID=100035 RepID=A0A7C8IAG2_9PLEO|nr:peptidase family C78-domain-containing protein [Massariosphaeria phaeospora]
MATTALLECPICDFTVLPDSEYVLQLHFEQVHTTDSPFRIEGEEVLPPPLPPRPSPSITQLNDDSAASSEEEEDTVLPPLPPRPSSKSKQPKHDGDTPSSREDQGTVLCPELNCGELVLLTDFNDHLDYHSAETLSFDESTGKYHSHQPANMPGATADPKGSSKPSFLERKSSPGLPDASHRNEDANRKLKKKAHRGRGDSMSSEKSTLSRSILSFNPFAKANKMVKPPPGSVRLGKDELGPHAWEDRMPKWLHEQLAAGPKITNVNRIGRDGRLIKQEQVQNETPGIIPILAQLSAIDHTVKEAYYCHPSTLHIGKTPKEGGFCGYRNIQMLVSYIQGAKAQGFEEFPGRTPGILKVQDLIESAWDKGINEIGRAQTGGIKGTRKYIGTPEAQAFFLGTQIDCAVELFTDSPDGQIEAHEQLFSAIEQYFAQAAFKDDSNVYKTLLPPIYLQQPGHSTTIVGFERRINGSCNLIVHDPMYHTSPAMHRLLGRRNIRTARPEVLHAYRRGAKQLKKHAAFEVLMLTAHPPLFPAWDV